MGCGVLADRRQCLKIELGRVDSQCLDQFERDVLLLGNDRKEQVLCAHGVGMKARSQISRDPHDLLTPGRESLVIEKSQVRRLDIELRDHVTQPFQSAVIVAQDLGSDSLGLSDQAQKQMFRACVVLFVVSGCALCQADRLLRIFRIVFSH